MDDTRHGSNFATADLWRGVPPRLLPTHHSRQDSIKHRVRLHQVVSSLLLSITILPTHHHLEYMIPTVPFCAGKVALEAEANAASSRRAILRLTEEAYRDEESWSIFSLTHSLATTNSCFLLSFIFFIFIFCAEGLTNHMFGTILISSKFSVVSSTLYPLQC